MSHAHTRGKPVIENDQQLADEVGEETPDRVGRRLYKATECGIGFAFRKGGIILAGYCEGTDRECPSYEMNYPFEANDFWKTVEQADKDGCELWNQTHGCEKCWPNGTVDDVGNTFEPGEIGGPVNPDCQNCQGFGIVL